MKEHVLALRQNMTAAENRLWYFLRDRRLKGYKFVRQLIIGPYITDFVCREKKLIIELDGSQHLDAVEADRKRTEYLSAEGFKLIRFWNNEVFDNCTDVLERILTALE